MVCCTCGLEAVIRTSWTNRNPGRCFYGCPTLSPKPVSTYLRWYDTPIVSKRNSCKPKGKLSKQMKPFTYEALGAPQVIYKAVFVEVIELKKELPFISSIMDVIFKELCKREIRQFLDIIDERRSFIREFEQRLPTNVMAYKTRQELKCHQKDDMIRAMEMRSTTLQLHHQAMKGFHFYKSL
ncbi:zinc finger, GRF-type containing protein [Tanacetum coccineum]|uniref:Zinc finger, GRF-type containing protein n=1 Tax=Tanacetum coccineum TaxID=301880 RepID=A0ABQ4YQ14_9ASTR